MNVFARSVFWALPVWGVLLAFRFIYIPYDFWADIVKTIIRPGVVFWFQIEGQYHTMDWFNVITTNMLIYYLAVVLAVFVADKMMLRGGSANAYH